MREQRLIFYPLMSLTEIDWKIKDIGKQWRDIRDISISYYGGAYQLSLLAKQMK